MSNTLPSLDLIRYLFVLEVNAPFVWLPKWPAMELSLLLGEKIADRLPTVEARPWKKALAAWERDQGGSFKNRENHGTTPSSHGTPWPIDAVIFWYPAKRSYGKGERILFELKLLGDTAEHELFIEAILPAMEEIAMSPPSQSQSYQTHPLWGRFDICSVYSARGSSWKPLLKNGRLDLRRKVHAAQWAMGLHLGESGVNSHELNWISPFLIEGIQQHHQSGNSKGEAGITAPTLANIIGSVAERVCSVVLGKYASAEDFVTALDHDARLSLSEALRLAKEINVSHHRLKKTSHIIPETGIGRQTFSRPIPHEVIPFLELGAILHVGKYCHFGLGTFTLLP